MLVYEDLRQIPEQSSSLSIRFSRFPVPVANGLDAQILRGNAGNIAVIPMPIDLIDFGLMSTIIAMSLSRTTSKVAQHITGARDS